MKPAAEDRIPPAPRSVPVHPGPTAADQPYPDVHETGDQEANCVHKEVFVREYIGHTPG